MGVRGSKDPLALNGLQPYRSPVEGCDYDSDRVETLLVASVVLLPFRGLEAALLPL